MSKDQFDLDEALNDDATPAGLRKWAETVKAQNKHLADELAGFKAKERRGDIARALKDLGVNEKVATFYPADAEASPEKVAEWAKEFADVFGPRKSADETESAGQKATDHNPLALDAIAAMRQIQDATPTSGSTPTWADKAAEIDGLKMKTAEDRGKLDAFERELMDLARQQQQAYFGSMNR